MADKPGWRPIETAPKDEWLPILCCNAGCQPFICEWDPMVERFLAENGCDYRPKFWMPLPPPPVEGKAE